MLSVLQTVSARAYAQCMQSVLHAICTTLASSQRHLTARTQQVMRQCCRQSHFGSRICTMHAERTAHNTHDAGEQSRAFDSARPQQVMRQCAVIRISARAYVQCIQPSHIPAFRTMPCAICRTTHVPHTRTHIAPIDKGDPTMRSNRLDIVFSQRCPVGYPGAARARRAAERKVCPR